MPYLRAKGSYTGAGYCEASLRQPVPDSLVTTLYSPGVAMVDHAEAGDLPVTHSIVLPDADFHNGIAGVTIVEAAGSFGRARVPAGVGAASGVHRLIVKSDCNARLHQFRLAGVSLHDQLRTAPYGTATKCSRFDRSPETYEIGDVGSD
ncbi:hypothetical protein RFM99_20350 [Mesorhizobium sp. VK4C]|uniref:hypothetical protein n=1 Tax=Mesorhizobium captivum TaxID=3072319 RepID=UPI002A23C440|nr:hypothetical protein [Mesorhizobium sp. VK4C]MDX8500757.1 hypothetical protein [Mesorhizobium sp. VK4C]